jgi:hypothetical protein
MSLEAARDLSIADLLRVLSDKLGLEYTRLQGTWLPPALEPEVSAPRSANVVMRSNSSELYRLKLSKPKRAIF